MDTEQTCRLKADALLSAAASTANLKLRGELIDEAMRWQFRALAADTSAIDWDDELPAEV